MNDSPNSGPQTRGIISKMALQDESSKHNCRANRQFKIAIGAFISDPVTIKKIYIFNLLFLHMKKKFFSKKEICHSI